jgi:hypothetical protein
MEATIGKWQVSAAMIACLLFISLLLLDSFLAFPFNVG